MSLDLLTRRIPLPTALIPAPRTTGAGSKTSGRLRPAAHLPCQAEVITLPGRPGCYRAAGFLAALLALFLQRAGLAQTVAPEVPMSGAVPPGSSSGSPAVPRRPAGPIVKLWADDPRVTLQLRVDSETWRDVCLTPCGGPLDASRTYRVAGRPFTPSDPFTLPRSSGQVTIDAHMGSKAPNTVGKILTPVGFGLTVAGVLLYWLGSQQSEKTSETDVPVPSSRTVFHGFGAAGMVAGGGITIAGAILWLSSGSTLDIR